MALEPLLAGTLDVLTLASVLQLVEAEGLDGTVHFAEGSVQFRSGVLVDAGFLGLTGPSAVVEASVRVRGAFRLLPDGSDTGSSMGSALHPLIIEGFRVGDELARFGSLIPSQGQQIGLLSGDGRSSLSELIAATAAHVVDVVPALLELEEAGVSAGAPSDQDPLEPLVVRPEPTGPERGPDPLEAMSFDDLVFVARRLVRDRRFGEARAHLNRAETLRPGDRMVGQNLKRLDSLEARNP